MRYFTNFTYFIVLPVLILWLIMPIIAETNNKFSNFCRSGTNVIKSNPLKVVGSHEVLRPNR